MNKTLKLTTLIATGALLGAVAGKFALNEFQKTRKGNNSLKIRNVKDFMANSNEEAENPRFI